MWKTPVVVEIFYSGAWHDITSDVLTSSPITITRGRADESQQPAPGRLTLSLNNPNATYSPRNPLSALYGLIGRNTQIRVSVTGYGTRFVGEIESWPQNWDTSQKRAWVPILAYGLLRRLGGSGTRATVKSALSRSTSLATTTLVGYWPLERGVTSGTVDGTTALAGNPEDVTVSYPGDIFSSFADGPPGSDASTKFSVNADSVQSPVANPAIATFPPRNFTDLVLSVCLRVPRGEVRGQLAADPLMDINGTIRVTNAGATSLSLNFVSDPNALISSTKIQASDGTNTVNYTDSDAFDGLWRRVVARFTVSGSDLVVRLYVDGVLIGSSTHTGGASVLSAALSQVEVLNLWSATTSGTGPQYLAHLIVADGYDDQLVDVGVMNGDSGEQAHDRLTRIGTEEAFTLSTFFFSSTAIMGPQPTASVLGLIQDCVDADGGFIREDRTLLGLEYISQDVLYNLAATASLSYTGEDVSPPLQPVEDTRNLVNDVTVSRPDGGSAHVVQDSGPLNVNEPADDPQGVGRYPKQYSLNVETDDQALQQASWKLYLGTFDEPRYPTITADLTALHEAGKTALLTDVVNLDVSSRVEVTDPPAWQGPDDISQLIQGYTETIASHHWTITFNTSPARVYDVGMLDTDRFGTAGSTLAEDLDTTETGVDVNVTGYPWSVLSVPYDIIVDGERMTVTAVQERISYLAPANTAVADGVAISPSLSGAFAAGDLMFAIGACWSNSLTITTGWTKLAEATDTSLPNGKLILWAKVHSGSESDPTITPAGSTSTIQGTVFALRGVKLVLDGLVRQNNPGLQDIPYPAFTSSYGTGMLMLIAHKRDDWSSVSTPAGFTQQISAPTTTGNDQGIYLATIATPASLNSGTLTVTGGTSVNSNVILVSVPPSSQTLTVTRSVNGAIQAHATGAQVQLHHPFRLAR